MKIHSVTLMLVFPVLIMTAAAAQWPGLPPDCWQESRIYHGAPPNWLDVAPPKLSHVPLLSDTNKIQTALTYSTNNAYYFTAGVTLEPRFLS